MDRAYSVLHVKSVREEDGFVRIEGIASTPTVDRVGDVVEPMGARFKTPMPLLWQHRHDAPVGNVTFAKPTTKGIPFKAELPQIAEPGTLKDRVDEAIHSMKYGLVTAVSIGFSAIAEKVERLKDGGLRFVEWDWHELSLVTIPANADAVITAIKTADAAALASAGIARSGPAAAADDSGRTKRGPVQLVKPTKPRQPLSVNVIPRKSA